MDPWIESELMKTNTIHKIFQPLIYLIFPTCPPPSIKGMYNPTCVCQGDRIPNTPLQREVMPLPGPSTGCWASHRCVGASR